MSAGDGSPAMRALRKWGPFCSLMAAVVLLAVVVVMDDDVSGTPGGGADVANGSVGDEPSETGAPPPIGRMPLTHAEAAAAGTLGEYEWGEACDTERGTVMVPSVGAAPCVPVFEGDNGGATHTGVGEDRIVVVWYDASDTGGLDSLLGNAGLKDSGEQQFETIEQWAELFSSVTETYGREVQLVRYVASGGMDDAVAAQADAERIATDIQPFAVLGGPPSDGGAFAAELARNEIICLGCALGMPECRILDNAPYNWGTEPSTSQFVAGLTAWLTPGPDNAGLAGNAEFAGDERLRSTERSFGVVHFDQDPPVMSTCPGQKSWPEDFVVESYLLDFATMPQVAAEIVAKMSAADVTSIIFAGDPIMPIYLTSAAEAIDYHPEWIFTGTVLTDTNSLARLYDQSQMAHAFGVSQTGVPVAPGVGGALDLYRWYFGADAEPPAPSTYQVLLSNIPRLFSGIQMAGPDLDPTTFERALFRIPPTGGDPVNPQQSHGHWSFFARTDYNGTDDLAEIWWDAEATGPDETGKEGTGMWRYAHGGARFTPDDPPDPAPFDPTDTVTRFEQLPGDLQAPDYPPPAGSPAAGA